MLEAFLVLCVLVGLTLILVGGDKWEEGSGWRVGVIAGVVLLVVIFLLTPFG